ncbi:MAG: hypothetical protein ACREJQ_00415, partial [bacterium]
MVVKKGYDVSVDAEAFLAIQDGSIRVDSPDQTFAVDFLDIDDVVVEGLEAMASVADGRLITFSNLGRQWEGFVDQFEKGWHQAIRQTLLPAEPPYKKFVCNLKFTDSAGQMSESEAAEFWLFSDGIAAISDSTGILHIFFQEITNAYFEPELFNVNFTLEDGSTLTVRRLGKRFSEFQLAFDHMQFRLLEHVTSALKCLFPEKAESNLYRLAKKMGAGRALDHSSVESCARGFWLSLESAVCVNDASRYHLEFLKTLTTQGGVYLGLRFPPKAASPTTWFLVACTEKHALFAEVSGGEPPFTYCFRLSPGAFDSETQAVNRALLLLDFRMDALALDEKTLSAA